MAAMARIPTSSSLLHDRDDFGVAALAGQLSALVASRCGQIPTRGSAPCCIRRRTISGVPLEHRIVQRPVLVVLRHAQIDQLRARLEHRAHGREIACAHGISQPPDGDAVHIRLQLGPAVKSVRSREHELGVDAARTSRACAVVVGIHLRERVGVAGRECLQQLFGLAFELVEVGLCGQRADGRMLSAGMMSSFPGRALASAVAPGVRSLGQKRVHRIDRS